jgi:hypothetical protein
MLTKQGPQSADVRRRAYVRIWLMNSSRTQPGMSHRDFLERALVAAGEWSRFADPKLLGVLVLLGLGVTDLVDHGGRFLHPHDPVTAKCDVAVRVASHSCAGILATTSFVASTLLAAATVLFLTPGLFPRLRMRGLLPGDHESGPITSMFFFNEVARHGSQQAYRVAVNARTEQELLDDIAGQVYEISKVTAVKYAAAQRAFVFVILFLVAWATARVALSLVG